MKTGSAAKKRKTTPVETVFRSIKLKKQNQIEATNIESKYSLKPATARILSARGFTDDEKLKTFLNPALKDGLPPPSELLGIEQAAQLVADTVKNGEKIALCCDFDVDGLSGGAQVFYLLKSIGADVEIYVPDRFTDGYGLNLKIIDQIAASKCSLMITIDFGTTNQKELTYAREHKIKSIVIDHHHVGEHLPGADIFVNPQQKNCGFASGILSASGLAWYFIVALRNKLPKSISVDPRDFLDLACLGTICDMVPLIGPNRVIAKRGLEVLERTERVGLKALKEVIGLKKIGCTEVSFGIGPRLNAAGRLVHGSLVIELLATKDHTKAVQLARQLNDLNLERQETESLVKERAIEELQSRGYLEAGIVVWNPSFHTGVIGIVAQRLVEQFYRPAAVMGIDKDRIYKGSVRGIKGISVVDTLNSVSQYLIKFGGHEGAGGFSLEEKNVERFAKAFVEECQKKLQKLDPTPYAEADTVVEIDEITVSLVDQLKQLAPFGMGNPNPQILIKNLKVIETRDIKGAHLKATLSDGKKMITGIMWRQASHPAIKSGNQIDVVARADYNNYNGLTEMQLIIQAAALSN